jgi:hypothetical protein
LFILALVVANAVVHPLIDRYMGDPSIVFGLVMSALVLIIGLLLFRTWKLRRPQH